MWKGQRSYSRCRTGPVAAVMAWPVPVMSGSSLTSDPRVTLRGGAQPRAVVGASIYSTISGVAFRRVMLKPGPSRLDMYVPERTREGTMSRRPVHVNNCHSLRRQTGLPKALTTLPVIPPNSKGDIPPRLLTKRTTSSASEKST